LSLSTPPGAALASLGSGSRGNGTLVAMGGCRLLVDCGFTVRQTRDRLARLGLVPQQLTAILVTHEHADHVQGVMPLARQYGLPVYLSYGTRRGVSDWRGIDVRTFDSHAPFQVGNVRITPVPVPHDAREPTQFVFEAAGRRLGVLTDLGHVTRHVAAAYRRCDALLVEANHDTEMLWRGDYPLALKRRIASPLGHLANEQTVALLHELGASPSRYVVVGHISEQNNDAARIAAAFAGLDVSFANQQHGFDWLSL
jgi:phosphoribosyl 1,2-cyclic phosphodiesterase